MTHVFVQNLLLLVVTSSLARLLNVLDRYLSRLLLDRHLLVLHRLLLELLLHGLALDRLRRELLGLPLNWLLNKLLLLELLGLPLELLLRRHLLKLLLLTLVLLGIDPRGRPVLSGHHARQENDP